jgi:hypothetical protein
MNLPCDLGSPKTPHGGRADPSLHILNLNEYYLADRQPAVAVPAHARLDLPPNTSVGLGPRYVIHSHASGIFSKKGS